MSRLSVLIFLNPSRVEEVSLPSIETFGFDKPVQGPDQVVTFTGFSEIPLDMFSPFGVDLVEIDSIGFDHRLQGCLSNSHT